MNVFRIKSDGSAMICNLEDAKSFIAQCKNYYGCYLAKGVYLEIDKKGTVSTFQNVDEWTDLELERASGDDGAKLLYKYRKYINARFKERR